MNFTCTDNNLRPHYLNKFLHRQLPAQLSASPCRFVPRNSSELQKEARTMQEMFIQKFPFLRKVSLCLAGRQTKYGHKREDFKLNLHLHTDLTFDPQETLLHCHNMLNLLQLKQLLKHMDFPSLQTLDLRKLNPTRFISQQGSTKTVKKTKPSKSGKG